MELFPGDNWILWVLANLYSGKKEYKTAISIFKQRTAGTNTNWALGYAYGMDGNEKEARRVLDYNLQLSETRFVPPTMIAAIYAGLGEKDKALEWLEKELPSIGEAYIFLTAMFDPRFDSIRDHPRFKGVYDRAGVSQYGKF